MSEHSKRISLVRLYVFVFEIYAQCVRFFSKVIDARVVGPHVFLSSKALISCSTSFLYLEQQTSYIQFLADNLAFDLPVWIGFAMPNSFFFQSDNCFC